MIDQAGHRTPPRGREIRVEVRPSIPERLARLEEIADNLWYSWHRPARALFAALDVDLWRASSHNPKLVLRRVSQQRLDAAAANRVYLQRYHQVLADFDVYHDERDRRGAAAELGDDDLVAYFCAEYGLHEGLQIYSGGLGILAGHHCKTASDLRLPFVGVGLLYRTGYFSQRIDGEGRQLAEYLEADFDALPLHDALRPDGTPCEVAIRLPGRDVHARVWEVKVGHMRLVLLDTDIEANSEGDRAITHRLYGGDNRIRIAQELLLGVGGVRALRALGCAPSVWHVNEGHAAFQVLERVREFVATGIDAGAALETVAAATVFTTHTPVPAGHDVFASGLAREYLQAALPGLDLDRVLSLGAADGGDGFDMTNLAVRGSRYRNGVSRLHGRVSSEICAPCWPEVPAEENPIEYVTNGVHVATILAQDWIDLFDRTLGHEWRNRLSDHAYWQRVHDIPDQLFWSVRQATKSQMLTSVRERLEEQLGRNRVSKTQSRRVLRFLDPDDPNVLTIGFARRFATYKRATLVLSDLERLHALVSDPDRPVVLVFGGKAHPADEPGQSLLRRVHEVSRMPEFAGHVVVVEGYDLALARRLLPGVDVWLNNPIYPLEASGTSGMKAAINGVVNLSLADGWWAEGFEGDNGWVIHPSPHGDDPARRDAEDSGALYELLEDEVVPLYYSHGRFGFSPDWVALAKRSMASVMPRFNTQRMVDEYITRFYVPAARQGRALAADACVGGIELAQWRERVEAAWSRVELRLLEAPDAPLGPDDALKIAVGVNLGGLEASDLAVELVDTDADPGQPQPRFGAAGAIPGEPGWERFELEIEAPRCGLLRARVRAYPHHPLLAPSLECGRMRWL